MLAELLLAGIASMDVGLKTAKTGFEVGDLNTEVNNQSLYNYEEDYLNEDTKQFYDYQESVRSVDGECVEYKEDVKLSQHFTTSQLISPLYENIESSKGVKGFESDVSGILEYKYDGYLEITRYYADYYRFFLYGDADVMIKLNNKYDNGKYTLYKLDTSQRDANLTKITESYDFKKDDISYYGMQESLAAGSYCICIDNSKTVWGFTSNSSQYNLSYSFNIFAEYEYGTLNEEYILNDISQNKRINAIAYVSDFNPFGIQPFNQETFKISSDIPTIEGTLKNFDKILHSSVILWGKDTRDAFYNVFNEVLDTINEQLDEKEHQKLVLQEVAKWVGLVETGLSLFFSVFEKPLELIVKLSEKTIKSIKRLNKVYDVATNTMSGLHLASGGDIPDSIADFVESFIPTNEILSLTDFKHYLQLILSALDTSNDSDGHEKVRISSYYKINKSGSDLEMCFDYDEMYKDNKINCEIISGEDYSNTIFKGKFYEIRNVTDFKDARNHIKHNFDMIPPDKISVKEITTDLNGDKTATLYPYEYCWFRFQAPDEDEEEPGTYAFASGGDAPENDVLVGELFDKVMVGRTLSETPIVSDDSNGFKGHFVIYRYLEPGETIYLRVHGKNWNTLNDQISVKAVKINGPDWNIQTNDTYFERSSTFKADQTKWRTLKFETSGYKIFQNFSHDYNASMKLLNARGETVAETNNKTKGYYGNGFLSAYVYDDQYYFLQMQVPSYGKTDNKLKVTITSAQQEYESIDDINKLELYRSYCPDVYGKNAFVGILTPELTAHYAFNVNDDANVDVYDTYSGEKVTKFSLEEKYYDCHGAVACLDAGHEYLIVSYFSNSESLKKTLNLIIKHYEDGEIVIPQAPIVIGDTYASFEKQFTVQSNSKWDYWVSFDNSGYGKHNRIFQLFGNSKDMVIELYDLRNNLLAKSDPTSGDYVANFLCNTVEEDEPYRIRVRNNNTRNIKIKLSITKTNADFNSFKEMCELKWDKYPNFSINDLTSQGDGFSGTGYFIAPETGMFEFCGTDAAYPRKMDIYVLDVTSNSLINYETDVGFGVPNYVPGGRVIKMLEKGHVYFVNINPEVDFGGAGEYIRISYFGKKLGNVNENGGHANTFDFDAGSSTQIFSGVYIPNRTGFVCFDAVVKNNNLANDVNISIFDKFLYDFKGVKETVM